MYDPYALFEKIVLQNGLTVYYQHWERPWVKLEFMIHAGSREDPSDLPGIAHFVEHCASSNVDGMKNQDILDYFNDTGGGVYLGGTSYLTTHYGFNIPAQEEMLATGLSILGKMLLQGTFENRTEEERKIITREYSRAYPFNKFRKWDLEKFEELFQGHRIASPHEPLGTLASIEKISREDLRDYYGKYYVPANMSVLVLGGIPKDTLIEKLQASAFGAQKPGVRNLIPVPFVNLRNPKKPGLRISLSELTTLSTEQTTYTGYWAIPGDVSTEIIHLGCMMLNRHLHEELREKIQGTYSASSQYTDYQDVRMLSIQSAVSPEIDREMDERVMECVRLATEDESLFEKIKRRSLSAVLMSDLSGRKLMRNCMNDLKILQTIESMQTIVERREQTTFKEVQDFLRLVNPERRFSVSFAP